MKSYKCYIMNYGHKADEILVKLNFDVPILDFYRGYFNECFAIYHPFYKQVFHDNYDWLTRFEETHKLIETISWNEFIRLSGIKRVNDLGKCVASAVDVSPEDKERYNYALAENCLNAPYCNEDIIPEDILLSFLQHLLQKGYTEIRVGDWMWGNTDTIENKVLTKENIFKSAIAFRHKRFITTLDLEYCLQLPYKDSACTFFLSKNEKAERLSLLLGYEGRKIDPGTKTFEIY